MKILVIFTGGTIGSTIKKGWISTDTSTKYTLIDSFAASDGIVFETSAPYTVLSENLSANEINMLQKEVIKALEKDYDGIIITHGTDTLQYTATALEYSVSGCNVPVVFVSSDYPLEDKRTNGHINFEAAVEFIRAQKGNGVFVSYKNDNENIANIHIASHILQHGECSANIYSIDGSPYASYSEGKIAVTKAKDNNKRQGLGYIPFTDCPDILLVDSHPGDGYGYSLENVKAVLLKPYHSATLNTSSLRFQDFCKKAAEKNIPVFVVNIHPGISYESSKLFEEMNIISLPFSTYVSAYIKMWVSLSLNTDIADFVKKAIADEIID